MAAHRRDDLEFEEIKRSFLAGVSDRLEIIESNLLNMENHPDLTSLKEGLRSVMSETHSLKGSAAAHELQIIVTVCHKLEDSLVAISEGFQSLDKEMISFLLKFLDLIKAYTADYLSKPKVNDLKYKEALLQLVPHSVMDKRKAASAKTVLLVGSSRSISKKISILLEYLSCKVSYASSGYEALGRLLNEHFDLVISAVQMDPIDGIALSSIIKIQKKRIPVQVVLLSDDPIHFINQDLKPDFIIPKNKSMVESLTKIVRGMSGRHVSVVKPKKPLRKILYIDDDADMIVMAKMAFKKASELEVQYLSDPKLLDQVIKDFQPDLLVSDIKMQGYDALETMKKLKLQIGADKMGFIYVSGDNDTPETRDLLKAGALAILNKQSMAKNFANVIKDIWSKV